MKINIIPYCSQDGIMTFRDSDIMGFYNQMISDDNQDIVFYAGLLNSREIFLSYMKREDVLLYLLSVDGDIVGLTWLDNLEDRTAFLHFCIFSKFWGKDTIELGKVVLQNIMNIPCEDGYVFDLLKGLIPIWNKRAIDFALKCGGVQLGILPTSIWNNKLKKSEDAVFIYHRRGET